MRAVKVDKDKKLVLAEVDAPRPDRNEAVMRVHALSLNRGEVRRSQAAKEGWRPGWDIAGVIETAAADGSGPKAGQRVVGVMPAFGGWAEQVAVKTDAVAVLPDAVSFAEASCLPVAGLTALHAVAKRGDLTSRRVLITGATGGVGHIATQLAKIMGAQVVAAVRAPEHVAFAREHGADIAVAVGSTPEKASEHGPYDLILESVGGESFTAATKMVAPDGTIVTFGVSGASESKIDIGPFFLAGGRTIYGLAVFTELRREPASIGLARLARLIADKRLKLQISVEKPWTQIDEVARELLSRKYLGKAVLHVK